MSADAGPHDENPRTLTGQRVHRLAALCRAQQRNAAHQNRQGAAATFISARGTRKKRPFFLFRSEWCDQQYVKGSRQSLHWYVGRSCGNDNPVPGLDVLWYHLCSKHGLNFVARVLPRVQGEVRASNTLAVVLLLFFFLRDRHVPGKSQTWGLTLVLFVLCVSRASPSRRFCGVVEAEESHPPSGSDTEHEDDASYLYLRGFPASTGEHVQLIVTQFGSAEDIRQVYDHEFGSAACIELANPRGYAMVAQKLDGTLVPDGAEWVVTSLDMLWFLS